MSYPICVQCDKPMRRKRESLADHPGTVSRQNQRICNSCGNKLRNKGISTGDPNDVFHQVNVRGLTRFMKARKNRQTPRNPILRNLIGDDL